MRYLNIASTVRAEEALKKIGVDWTGLQSMLPKMKTFNILLEEIECKVANILKQEMLSIGGDVAVARESVACSIDHTDAILIGTEKQMGRLAEKLSQQPFGLRQIAKDIKRVLSNLSRDAFLLRTPKREISIAPGKTLIMGILNITPDSFSDGGIFSTVEDAVEHALRMEEAGVDIIDIGGESSRPGSEPVSVDRELKRVLPVIERLSGLISVPISIDTTKAAVAHRSIEAGAEIVNDISAMRFDEGMPEVIASHGVPVVLMHMRGTPGTMQAGDLSYRSLMGEIIGFLEDRMDSAQAAGIDIENIIVDPGIGFGKSTTDNIAIINSLKEIRTLGRPILVGASRKRFIGDITGKIRPEERLEGTSAAVTASILNGANIVRVHDVEFIKKVATVADEIK